MKNLNILRDRLLEIFCDDGISDVERVDVELCIDDFEEEFMGEIVLFGYSIAKRHYRDSEVILDKSVFVKRGGFPSRGGSSKYPFLKPEDGTILKIKDVPKGAYEKEIESGTTGISLIVKSKEEEQSLPKLLEERKRHLKRLIEINKKIKELE